MARDNTPVGKQSRREGVALHPKAHKLLVKKPYVPGQHGRNSRARLSEYGTQLREKQKIRRTYGLLEKQFRNIITEAQKSKGQTGESILKLLELRADNIVYRAGFANSRRSARQLVNHGHFLLDGKKVDIPSIRLKEGQVLEVSTKAKSNSYFKELLNNPTAGSPPKWLKVDAKGLKISVLAMPSRDDVTEDFNEQAVVEFYSR
ncbi:MAG: 30S ribosomal protein S4 [Candidatus Nomurabacteria bacterium]|nr:MAG: 30S ribosomal protein S4 [Candidatus Nomurabacteria bacterium]